MLNNNEADGLVENNAEKIKITISSTGINDIELVNQIQGYYHPEQFINGVEKNYYLEEYSSPKGYKKTTERINFVVA